MAKSKATQVEDPIEDAPVEAPKVEATTYVEPPKVEATVGHPSRDFKTPINRG